VRCTCPICASHLGTCYWELKKKSGLLIDKASSSNGYRTKLSEPEWWLLGVDLSWPPPPDPNVAPADRWLLSAHSWEPSEREASLLARELQWLSRIGAEDLAE
jgi:hypothetical protein